MCINYTVATVHNGLVFVRWLRRKRCDLQVTGVPAVEDSVQSCVASGCRLTSLLFSAENLTSRPTGVNKTRSVGAGGQVEMLWRFYRYPHDNLDSQI